MRMQIPRWRKRLVRPGCAHEADSGRVEVARALIARVKAADSSINRRDELCYASDSDALDRRDWHVRRFAPRMGDGPVTESGTLGSRSRSKLEDALQARDAHRAAAAQTRQRQLRVAAARKAAESAWWTVLDCLPKRSSPEWGAA